MSIRIYKKDHLKEHTGVSLVPPVRLTAPESNDPLRFWTRHDKEPCEVNLHPFATGQQQSNSLGGGGKKFVSFSGRPDLIRQLAPAIEEAVLYAGKKTVAAYATALRDWWRILDLVEAKASQANQPMTRVEDVSLLTHIHSEFAHRSGMTRQSFGKFRSLVDTTRIALGERKTYWESPEKPGSQKHIPPQELRNALRFAVRSACRRVLERWAQSDRLSQNDAKPADVQESELQRNVKYMRSIQQKSGKQLPKPDDLYEDIPRWAINTNGNFKLYLQESVFPTHKDADAVWHQCLVNTGWNPSTLTSLDATKKFLFDHFKDDPKDPHKRWVLTPQTYELIGTKERSGGNEQFVTGQWKTLDGPGHLIKTYMERVEPLREVLNQQLTQEKIKYQQMESAKYTMRTIQFAKIKTLEQGIRSVWLYVNRQGAIGWISQKYNPSGLINGKQVTYLAELVHLENTKRAASHAQRVENREALYKLSELISHVAPKEFRVWFADYVYRSSNGSMLHVKRALNHAQLRTSNTYVNTKILNQEASDAARRFLNILVDELDTGRVDLTIIAHLFRYGEVTPEQEVTLAQLRVLPKSRMKVACKDSAHPPAHLKATAHQPCDVQRCLLCVEHAVLLPESLDGIAMRAEELRALQGFLPIETWIEERYDIELKNNLIALRKFDLNQGLAARKRWAHAIASGEHYVPGLPMASSPDLMELA